jgi:hypothetical protein
VGSKAFGGLHRRLKEKTAESRWFETTGQAPFGRAKAAYWKIKILQRNNNRLDIMRQQLYPSRD